MKLYLLTQDKIGGYDTYDAVVVAAAHEPDARNIHPCFFVTHITGGKWMGTFSGCSGKAGQEYESDDENTWPRYADIGCIMVKYLGETTQDRGVILASFNAG